MGDFPAWLQVLLALAGLFTGAGAGTYYGGVRRARLEDRREILRMGLEWADTGFLLPPPGFTRDERTAYDNGIAWALGPDPALQLHATLKAIEDVNKLVRLLPWRDRALWHRVLSPVASIGGGDLHEVHKMLNVLPLDLYEQDELRDFLREFRPAFLRFYKRLRAANAFRSRGETALPLLERWGITSKETIEQLRRPDREFEEHLLRQVNPTFMARLKDIRLTIRLFKSGPRPWEGVIQPTAMTVERQLRGGPNEDDASVG